MKGHGRKEYKQLIEKNVGEDYIESLIAMESALDTINATRKQISIFKHSHDLELKQNIAVQFKTISSLSNEMLKRRIDVLGKEANITDYAHVLMDKQTRDKNLLNALKEFKSNLPKDFKINIEPGTIKDILKEFVDENQLNKEIENIKLKEHEEELLAKEYDNNQLINKTAELAKNYDFSRFPLKDRIELTVFKNIGNIKRIFNPAEYKIEKLPEKSTVSLQEKREEFVSTISENDIEKQNNIDLNELNNTLERKGKDENIR